jgi:hypothetical protein
MAEGQTGKAETAFEAGPRALRLHRYNIQGGAKMAEP